MEWGTLFMILNLSESRYPRIIPNSDQRFHHFKMPPGTRSRLNRELTCFLSFSPCARLGVAHKGRHRVLVRNGPPDVVSSSVQGKLEAVGLGVRSSRPWSEKGRGAGGRGG